MIYLLPMYYFRLDNPEQGSYHPQYVDYTGKYLFNPKYINKKNILRYFFNIFKSTLINKKK